MKTLINWGNVGNWCCALSGVLIGLGASPLVFRLSDKSGVATVVGAALGAGITVLGALWVNKSKEIKERKAIRKAAIEAAGLVDAPFQRVQASFSRLELLVDQGRHRGELTDEQKELNAAFVGLSSTANIVFHQLESLTAVYQTCGPTVAVAHFHMTASIDTIRQSSGQAGRDLQFNVYGVVQEGIKGYISNIRQAHKDITEDLGQI